MSFNTRNSSLAIVPEVVEGTPVAPTAASQYIALQPDWIFAPNFEQLANEEMKPSLGKSKTIVGSESPTASGSHYLRHSAVEATAPDFHDLPKAIFGSETIDTTEEVTDAASTVSTIKLTANGAHHPRGSALLIKDSTNGFSIRPVLSVATNDLTLGVNVATAPGAGVGVGKCIAFAPENSGHQTLNLWHYVGTSGAVEMIAGCRVVSMGVDFSAGQLINANYQLEGLEYFFNPIEITASNNNLDFTTDNGTYAVAVTADFYKDPHDLATAVQTAMAAADTAETLTCVYSDSTGKFTIASSTSTVLSLLWKTGTSGADGTDTSLAAPMGFADAADDTAATTYTSDTAQSLAPPQTGTFDDSDPLVAKSNEVFLGEVTDTTSVQAAEVSFSFGLPKTDKMSVAATSGRSGSMPAERECTVSISMELDQYDADKFRRMRQNTSTMFCYNFGVKSGGNWVAGKCGNIYIPTATISAFTIVDRDGLVYIDIELKTFVGSDNLGEVYLNLL